MKSSKYQVGDIVYSNFSKNQISKVVAIECSQICKGKAMYMITTADGARREEDFFVPVNITEYRLAENHIILKRHYDNNDNSRIYANKSPKGGFFIWLRGEKKEAQGRVFYMHELQQAARYSEIDIEIKAR